MSRRAPNASVYSSSPTRPITFLRRFIAAAALEPRHRRPLHDPSELILRRRLGIVFFYFFIIIFFMYTFVFLRVFFTVFFVTRSSRVPAHTHTHTIHPRLLFSAAAVKKFNPTRPTKLYAHAYIYRTASFPSPDRPQPYTYMYIYIYPADEINIS